MTFVSTTRASNAIKSGTTSQSCSPCTAHRKQVAGEMESLVIETLQRARFHMVFNDAVAKSIENLNCTPDNLKDFILVQKLVVIRVHSCSLVVKPSPAARLRERECSDAAPPIQSA